MIKAFVFDYDGVITKGVDDGWVADRLSRNLGITTEKATDWLSEIWFPLMRNTITEDEVWALFEEKYGKPIEKSLRDIWFVWKELEPLPQMMELVGSLKASGFVLGVLSNVFSNTKKIIEEHGVYEHFDFVVTSCDVGYRKPELHIFKDMLGRLEGVDSTEVAYLDDRLENIAVAKGLGFTVIHVTDHATAIRQISKLAAM